MKKVRLCIPGLMIFSITLANPVTAFSQQKKPTPKAQSTEVAMPLDPPVAEESYLNTVTTTDTSGTKYKLVIIGDMRPKFFINSKQIDSDELIKYGDIIAKLTPILWQRQKQAGKEKKSR
jgi:hypothetical protein